MQTNTRNPNVRRVAVRLSARARANVARLTAAHGTTGSTVVSALIHAKAPATFPAEGATPPNLAEMMRYWDLITSDDPKVRPVAVEIVKENVAAAQAGERKVRRSIGREAWNRRNTFDEVEAIARIRLDAGEWGTVGNLAAEMGGTLSEALSRLVHDAIDARRRACRADAVARMEAARGN